MNIPLGPFRSLRYRYRFHPDSSIVITAQAPDRNKHTEVCRNRNTGTVSAALARAEAVSLTLKYAKVTTMEALRYKKVAGPLVIRGDSL